MCWYGLKWSAYNIFWNGWWIQPYPRGSHVWTIIRNRSLPHHFDPDILATSIITDHLHIPQPTISLEMKALLAYWLCRKYWLANLFMNVTWWFLFWTWLNISMHARASMHGQCKCDHFYAEGVSLLPQACYKIVQLKCL